MGSFVVSGAGGTFDVVSPSSKISHWLHSPSVLHSCDAIESVLPQQALNAIQLPAPIVPLFPRQAPLYVKHCSSSGKSSHDDTSRFIQEPSLMIPSFSKHANKPLHAPFPTGAVFFMHENSPLHDSEPISRRLIKQNIVNRHSMTMFQIK